MQIGYCTNVHAGANLAQTRENLTRHALQVKQRFRPNDSMGIGLWLSQQSARELIDQGRVGEFAEWLSGHGLLPFTLNGFPFGNFHETVVKHRVYEPTWWDERRCNYTLDLIDILHTLLPNGVEGSISTLPIAWGEPQPSDDRLQQAAAMLAQVATRLNQLEQETGRRIHICIEPEPGCFIQRTEDIVQFFEQHLLQAGDEAVIRRHLRACHDVCHAAVMFEEQSSVVERLAQVGIGIGKVQVSSAVLVDFAAIPAEQRADAISQLSSFAEDRYLHQTTVRGRDGTETFFEDLPLALATVDRPESLDQTWCVHFHVPVYLESFGLLGTSRQQIIDLLAATKSDRNVAHFEVETYAWGVLPPELQQSKLADGIAEELRWFEAQV